VDASVIGREWGAPALLSMVAGRRNGCRGELNAVIADGMMAPRTGIAGQTDARDVDGS
jgi:hypothetical protein